ncbi:MAG TPA: DUF5947 family protein [Candidatus Udaeobacter sp.]|nr:DUF5947 family protein [Candidatus Udaeobacter sp.]
MSSLEALRRFAGAPRTKGVAETERCELCSVSLSQQHRHLLEIASRKIVCACDACALRFQDVAGGRFKLVPRDARALTDFNISDSEWEALALPINLAFFFYSTLSGKMTAMYPSPGGATESLLPLTAWETLAANNPALRQMQPDVEALLANRVSDKRRYFIAPIDRCYELVGTIRMHWKGLSGGEEVWREIDKFFAELQHSG